MPALRATRLFLIAALPLVAACTPAPQGDGVFAPGIDHRASGEDGVEVGHRLISAGEYELALRAFSRASLDRGEADAEILLGMGTANLGLGRLNQAERLLRVSLEKQSDWPELYNNLGVVLMEQGKTREASAMFHRAFALDNGQSDSIRDNLQLALSKTENAGHNDLQNNDYKLVRRGRGDYLIQNAPT